MFEILLKLLKKVLKFLIFIVVMEILLHISPILAVIMGQLFLFYLIYSRIKVTDIVKKEVKETKINKTDKQIKDIKKQYKTNSFSIYNLSRKVNKEDFELLYTINSSIDYDGNPLNDIDFDSLFANTNISIFFIMLIDKPIGYYFLEEKYDDEIPLKTYKNIRIITEYNTSKRYLLDFSKYLLEILDNNIVIELNKKCNRELIEIFKHNYLELKEETEETLKYGKRERTLFEIAYTGGKGLSELSDEKLFEIEKKFSHHFPRSKGEFEDFGQAIENIRYEVRRREKYKIKATENREGEKARRRLTFREKTRMRL